MQGNPHLTAPLSSFGAPLRTARVIVILLHGRGGTPSEMDEQLVRRVAVPDVAYVAPAAAGQAWYPAGFMAKTEENEPHLTFALERLSKLSDDLAGQGIPASAQVIMGFSQGACLGSEFVYRQKRRFRALVALTGGLIGPPGTTWDIGPADYRDMPVVLGGSESDPWVPAARMLETAEVFRGLGARVDMTLYPGAEHVIRDEQIAETRALLWELSK